MKHWNEMRTAYKVAELGSVSAAAQALEVHRATVLRHVDVLERELTTKLFIRHAQGYIPTEAGNALLRVAKVTEEQFSQFAKRSKMHDGELSGDFVISSIDITSALLMPAIKIFQQQHPKIVLRYLSSEEIFKLEYGQAHIAVRTGVKPSEMDYVCLPFFDFEIGFFASKSYLAQHGTPFDIEDFAEHAFIAIDDLSAKPVMHQWMREHIDESNVVLRSTSRTVQKQALLAGLGIALLPTYEGRQNSDLVAVVPALSWQVKNWLVTHGDQHRSEKIQAFLAVIKSPQYLYIMKFIL
ncbi:MAG: LysR family transcriptional regulator [Oceanospirillaceae bacterium]|nr:LysR family transcriptional regulator [Oceanospirillaceae bacterium]